VETCSSTTVLCHEAESGPAAIFLCMDDQTKDVLIKGQVYEIAHRYSMRS